MYFTSRLTALAVALALCASASFAAEGGKALFEQDFESGKAWRPRSATVQSEIVTDASRSGKVLKVSGSEEKGWNYAWSPQVKGIEAGKKYRYSFDLLVKEMEAPSVFMKFEITFKDKSYKSQRFSTKKYDMLKGGWQTLTCTFTAPEGAVGGAFALEKGTNKATKIDCLIDNLKLVEVE